MTTIHRDDLTGKEYPTDARLLSFGLAQNGTLTTAFETHEEVYYDDPERIAAQLHQEVDAWLADTREYLENEREQEVTDR